jgi:hypothetical protein
MKPKQLRISRETLRQLEWSDMSRAGGAGVYTAQHTCFCSYKPTICATLVSCPAT